jgi:hypothetical protein
LSIGRVSLLSLAALCFAAAMLYLLASDGAQRPEDRSGSAVSPPMTIGGRLDIRTMADLRVGGRKVVLCGVTFSRPPSLEPFMREQARRTFQGNEVNCVQVGGGTPCDGRAAPSYEGLPVVQCKRPDGADLARVLSDSGYLCDVPAQSGGTYHAC